MKKSFKDPFHPDSINELDESLESTKLNFPSSCQFIHQGRKGKLMVSKSDRSVTFPASPFSHVVLRTIVNRCPLSVQVKNTFRTVTPWCKCILSHGSAHSKKIEIE